MPVFSVKKILKGPDQGEEEGEMMVEINVPNEIFSKILVMLDGRSLHTARQVCKDWNIAVKEQVLGTVEGRKYMENTLQCQWRQATPSRLVFSLKYQEYVLNKTDQFAVIFSFTDWSDNFKVVNIIDGLVSMQISSSASARVPQAILTRNVLLVVRDVGEISEVLAWLISTRQEIYRKRFPGLWPVFNQLKKQLMLGTDTLLEISHNTIKEVEINLAQPSVGLHPFLGLLRLHGFCDPFYLTRGLPDISNLYIIDKTTRVGVGQIELGCPIFCPNRNVLLICSRSCQNQLAYVACIKISFYNCFTGHLIKVRNLILPAGFKFFSVYNNCNQLVVDIRQQGWGETALLVYEFDCLLSESADNNINSRLFPIGEPGYRINRIDVNKLSLSVVLSKSIEKKIITLDFWKCKN